MNRDKPIFTSAADAEAALYNALEKGDLEALMAVWAEDEEIICVLPGGPRLVGFNEIKEAWRRIFANNPGLRMRVTRHNAIQGPFVTIHNLVEQVSVGSGTQVAQAPVVVTNVYSRGATGWRLLVHHASPAPPEVAEGPAPKILH